MVGPVIAVEPKLGAAEPQSVDIVAAPTSVGEGPTPMVPRALQAAFDGVTSSIGHTDHHGMSNVSDTSPVQIVSNTASGTAVGMDPGLKPGLTLMLKTFDFSIDTELVSRAVSEFTGSIDALVKTQ